MPTYKRQLSGWALLLLVVAASARPQNQDAEQDKPMQSIPATTEVTSTATEDEAKDVKPLELAIAPVHSFKPSVPIDPDIDSSDESKVLPEGTVRGELPANSGVKEEHKDTSKVELTDEASLHPKPTEPQVKLPQVKIEKTESSQIPQIPQQSPANEDKPKVPDGPIPSQRERRTRTYHPAEARDSDVVPLNLLPGTVLVPFYGGAKGQYLVVPASELHNSNKKENKKKKKPTGNKEEGEEEENVGEETSEGQPGEGNPGSDGVTITLPPDDASVAEARPIAVAVAGVGGVASARPTGTAVVGPGGLAISHPSATAIAGIQNAEYLIAAIGAPPQAPTAYIYPVVHHDVPFQTLYHQVQPFQPQVPASTQLLYYAPPFAYI